jgi:hypothetical protein
MPREAPIEREVQCGTKTDMRKKRYGGGAKYRCGVQIHPSKIVNVFHPSKIVNV